MRYTKRIIKGTRTSSGEIDSRVRDEQETRTQKQISFGLCVREYIYSVCAVFDMYKKRLEGEGFFFAMHKIIIFLDTSKRIHSFQFNDFK